MRTHLDMQILKQEAIYKEAEIGDVVELLEDYLLIRKGACGKIVEFGSLTTNHTIKVEFPIIEVGMVTHIPVDKDDRFLYCKPSQLKFIKKS